MRTTIPSRTRTAIPHLIGPHTIEDRRIQRGELGDISARRSGRLGSLTELPVVFGSQTMLLDFIKQSAITDIQILCGVAPVPTDDLKGILNELRFGSILHIAHDRSHTRALRR
jgi:hypothetical protein